MNTMRDVIRILENADFDHRTHDVADLHSFNQQEFSDKGRADIATHGVYPRADNAMGADEDELIIDIEEDTDSIEPDPVQLDQLHQILNGELQQSDEAIRRGPVHLDDRAKQDIAGQLGMSPQDVDTLSNTLTQKLRDEQGQEDEEKILLSTLGEAYQKLMQEIELPVVLQEAGHPERPFSEAQEPKKVNGWWYPGFQDPGPDHPLPVISKEEEEAERQAAAERVKKKRAQRAREAGRTDEARFYAEDPDSLGNITVRDTATGDSKYLQGGQATELKSKLSAGDNDAVLAPLFERAANHEGGETYNAEIAANSGTYNFPWHLGPHHGFATVFFNKDKTLELISVLNMAGEQIDLDRFDANHHDDLLKQAQHFIDTGKV